jgi:hypothetical protein
MSGYGAVGEPFLRRRKHFRLRFRSLAKMAGFLVVLPFVGFTLLLGYGVAKVVPWGEKLWHRATGYVPPVHPPLYHMRVDRTDGSSMRFHLRKEPKRTWVRKSKIDAIYGD